MASTVPPSKSQALHNFSLSQLKWKSNNQRPRSSSSSSAAVSAVRVSSSSSPHRPPPFSHDSPPRMQSLHSPSRRVAEDSVVATAASPSRFSPVRGGEDSSASRIQPGVCADESSVPPPLNHSPVAGKSEPCVKNSKPSIEYRRQSRNSESCSMKNGVIISSPDRHERESSSSRFLINIQQKTSKVPEAIQVEEEGEIGEVPEKGNLSASIDDDERSQKTWDFRPRKPIRPSLNLNGSLFKNFGSTVRMEKRAQSPQGNLSSRSETQKKEKRKEGFTMTLSREEIEEDCFAMMGSRPSRRPKKRSKAVQKLIDNVFPGAWLESFTADWYKVSEHPGKVGDIKTVGVNINTGHGTLPRAQDD
ncbi:hypothetical protein ACH5RR_023785 [Cinchona calisaya]|uniref:Uncharacterized protein n=1 Tax=Cinchona calisaya TaxID=153742 RepID=A0ABD2ZBP5_9GENT